MVDAYAQCRAVLAAYLEKPGESLVETFYLRPVLLVAVLHAAEGGAFVYEIAGVYAHLLYIASRYLGGGGVEVYVGHKRREVTLFAHSPPYAGQILRLRAPLSREAYELSSGVGYGCRLLCGALGIERVGGTHRLYRHTVGRTYLHISDPDCMARTAPVTEKRFAESVHGSKSVEFQQER